MRAAFIFESGLAFFPSSKSHLMGGIIALTGKIARFRSLKSLTHTDVRAYRWAVFSS